MVIEVADMKKYLAILVSAVLLISMIAALGTSYPVERVNEAFCDANAGKNIKTVLVK